MYGCSCFFPGILPKNRSWEKKKNGFVGHCPTWMSTPETLNYGKGCDSFLVEWREFWWLLRAMNPRHEIHFHPNFREKSGHFQATDVSKQTMIASYFIPFPPAQEWPTRAGNIVFAHHSHWSVESDNWDLHRRSTFLGCQLATGYWSKVKLISANLENYTLGTSLFCPHLVGFQLSERLTKGSLLVSSHSNLAKK